MVRFDSWGRLCDRNFVVLDDEVAASLLSEMAEGELQHQAAKRLRRLWRDSEGFDWLAGEGEGVDAEVFDLVT